MVDFKALMPVERPVTLAEVKAEPGLENIPLVRHSRLSVMPVSADEWRIICRMAGTKA